MVNQGFKVRLLLWGHALNNDGILSPVWRHCPSQGSGSHRSSLLGDDSQREHFSSSVITRKASTRFNDSTKEALHLMKVIGWDSFLQGNGWTEYLRMNKRWGERVQRDAKAWSFGGNEIVHMASAAGAGKTATRDEWGWKSSQLSTAIQNSFLQKDKAMPHNNAYDSTNNSECKHVCPRSGTKHFLLQYLS